MTRSTLVITIVIFLLPCLNDSSGNAGAQPLAYSNDRISSDVIVYDAIIVPGSPCNGESWSLTVQMRLIWAKYLFDNGLAKNIIVSGSSVYTKYNEAKVMAIYAAAMGIPSANIYEENNAEHSKENVYYSMHLAKKLGFKKLAVATDGIQLTFLLRYFMNQEKLNIDKLPVNIKLIKGMDHTEPSVDLSSAIDADFVSVKDRESIIERFRGTRGKHIKR
jgi:hypothetical protein